MGEDKLTERSEGEVKNLLPLVVLFDSQAYSTRRQFYMTHEEYTDMVFNAASEYVRMAKLENEDALVEIDYDLVKEVADTKSDFSLVEAAQIIEEFSDNVEEEPLWQTDDPEEAIKGKAYWTFNNDMVVALRSRGID